MTTGTGYDEDIAQVVLARRDLARRVEQLGRQISRDFAGRDPILIGVLKGTSFFFADLLRAMTIACQIDFLAISSYQSGRSQSGSVRFLKDLDQTIEGRHVLLVEDIIDTGLTLRYVLRNLRARRPDSLEVCCLLNKPARRLVEVELKYKGFDLADQFVVGYGLDYRQRYRNLPCVAVLREDIYAAR